MSTPLLATKLYIPPPRPKMVPRPRLIEQLNQGMHRKLTLISAPAGFGKTTLLSDWVAVCGRQVAWLSLDQGDSDPVRFLTYLVAALRTVAPAPEGTPYIGDGVLAVLQSPQPPAIEPILTALLNEITTVPDNMVLVLDDYHLIDAKAIDGALTYLIEHMPPQMQIVIATREDPQLHLPRLRARDQLTELRIADLRFTAGEAAEFLNQITGLNLSAEDIDALETRTEGWIAGLQLAALSLQGHQAPANFIKSFTGSHHFVMDYLVEEVLQQQSESVQTFLLRTSILDRLCGPLCDALLLDESASGQATLEYLEHANLFTIPLDNDRQWYRYHHLFTDLLRQRLNQWTKDEGRWTKDEGRRTMDVEAARGPSSIVHRPSSVHELHIRASQWYEDNGLEIEAFHHAVAANDVERAERLSEGKGIPLHFRGAAAAILDWLESLPMAVLNGKPSLWVKYASLLLVNGQTTGVEEKLLAAENALQGAEVNDRTRYLIGQIATARATLALTRYDIEGMLTQSRRALDYLRPNNLSLRANAYWTMGYGYALQGDRAAARRAISEAISLSQAAGSIFTIILATISLGNIQEADNQLFAAAETYRRVLQLAGDQPLQIIYEAHLGLARVLYEWNDLEGAEQHGQKSLHLARQYDRVIDRFILCELFLARLRLAHGDLAGAAAILAQAGRSARERNFVFRIPDVAAAQVPVLLRQGNPAAAAQLAQTYNLPLSLAGVRLAQGDSTAVLALLEPLRRQMEAKGWEDERLKVMVLQAVALYADGDKDKALHVLADALALAEPEGFIRTFVDAGSQMAHLLVEAVAHGVMPDYIGKLLEAFEAEKVTSAGGQQVRPSSSSQPLIEPLSRRELEVLHLVAQGLSNHEISERLFLALDSVKGHNRKIFGKLQVQSRTEAVARARELGLL